MTPRSSVLAGVVAAGLALAMPAAAWAHPAPAHPAPSHSKPAPHSHDRLAGPRRAAQQDLSAAARQLAALRATVTATALSDVDRVQADGALQAAADAITADVAAVPQAASVAALNTLKQAGRHALSVARLQVRAVVAADQATDRLDADQSSVDNLAASATAAEQAELDNAQQDLDAAAADLQDVTKTAGDLDTTSSDKDLAGAAATVGQDLNDAAAAMAAAENALSSVSQTGN